MPGGLAYDSVSHRFLVADLSARKLMVVGEGSTSAVDLVRAESAGFNDVTGIEIDPRRGDLWVVSTDPGGGIGALHKLQLISGRSIGVFEAPAALQPVRLADVAIGRSGMVLVLESAGQRILTYRAASKTLDTLMSFDIANAASLTTTDDEQRAYIAHAKGIVQIDLKTRKSAPVSGPRGIDLGGFERIRWYRNALVGSQVLPDGSRRLLRLALSRNGPTVTAATVIDDSLASGSGPSFATIAGDDLYYLVSAPRSGVDPSVSPSGVEVLVRRIHLR